VSGERVIIKQPKPILHGQIAFSVLQIKACHSANARIDGQLHRRTSMLAEHSCYPLANRLS
jgi:hypothetical protein